MPKLSAGLLMYRKRAGRLQVLLAHPGGPLWANKDLGVWTIPKGLVDADEDPLAAAKREFEEELGLKPAGEFLPIGEVVQKGGKTVVAWAFEGDSEPTTITSNTFTLEWPPRSGKLQTFPEVDRAAFFSIDQARTKINPAQAELLSRLETMIVRDPASAIPARPPA